MTATVLSLSLDLIQDDQRHPLEIAGAFDRIQSPEAARAVGRAIGDLVADVLERRLRHGASLADTTSGKPA